MKTILQIFIFLIIIAYSCTKEEIKIDQDNLLIGTWNYSDYSDNTLIFTRSAKFIDNHCYQFNSDGTLLERNIAGWCATPPVSYTDYKGKWAILNDTLIQLNVTYFDALRSYKLYIKSIDSNSLRVIDIGNGK
jgi:hypothetical protein